MSQNLKTQNIILRTDKMTHTIIKNKALLFNKKKSDYLRNAALSYWEDIYDTKHFKKLLQRYIEGDEIIKEEIIDILFQYYRRIDYPHNHFTDEQKENRLQRIIRAKNTLLEDDMLQMNPQGLDLANYFHPHMMESYYSNRKDISPYKGYE